MDAQTIAAQGTSTTAEAPEENIAIDRVLLNELRNEFRGISLEQIENQCHNLIQTTAFAIIELGRRLLFIRELSTKHGEWLFTLSRIGIEKSFAQRTMQAAIRFSALPDRERLLVAAKSKSKLFELLTLDNDEITHLSQGKAVRGVSLTTLPQISVAVLRSTLKDNAPGKCAVNGAFEKTDKYGVNDAFAEPASLMPPTGEPVMANRASTPDFGNGASTHHLADDDVSGFRVDAPTWSEANANVTSTAHLANQSSTTGFEVEAKASSTTGFEDPADYPAVYALLPGEYNGWPVSLIRHEGKTWLIANEVAAFLAQNGEELADIQAMLADWHAIDQPAGALLKIRLASTSTVLLVMDEQAVEMLDISLDTPASAALAAWSAGINTAPALAEVKELHEAPAEKTPGEYLDKLAGEYDQAHLILHNLVAQIRGVHELSELISGNQTKLGISDMAGMLAVTRNLTESYEKLFEDMDDVICDLRFTWKESAAIHA